MILFQFKRLFYQKIFRIVFQLVKCVWVSWLVRWNLN
jgi:hypothetical protein